MLTEEQKLKPYLVDIRDMLIHGLTKEAELSGTDVASLLNINKSTVSRVLKRKPSTSVSQFIKKIRK